MRAPRIRPPAIINTGKEVTSLRKGPSIILVFRKKRKMPKSTTRIPMMVLSLRLFRGLFGGGVG
ncbi:hypothetical protein D9M68_1000400 [compost metagenome]